MGTISWSQPFGSANKRTAYVTAKDFLQENGYTMNIKSQKDKDELIRLLNEIQGERSRLNPDIMKQIIFYTANHIEKL